VSPFLALTSPEKRCGKTTTLHLLSALVPRPLPASSISPAALFRAVERYRPTLLLDEADTVFGPNGSEDLRCMVNAGHTRAGAVVSAPWARTSSPDVLNLVPQGDRVIGELPGPSRSGSGCVCARRPRRRSLSSGSIGCRSSSRSAGSVALAQEHLEALRAADATCRDAARSSGGQWRPCSRSPTPRGAWPERAAGPPGCSPAAGRGGVPRCAVARGSPRAVRGAGPRAPQLGRNRRSLGAAGGPALPEWHGKPLTSGPRPALGRFGLARRNCASAATRRAATRSLRSLTPSPVPPIRSGTSGTTSNGAKKGGWKIQYKRSLYRCRIAQEPCPGYLYRMYRMRQGGRPALRLMCPTRPGSRRRRTPARGAGRSGPGDAWEPSRDPTYLVATLERRAAEAEREGATAPWRTSTGRPGQLRR